MGVISFLWNNLMEIIGILGILIAISIGLINFYLYNKPEVKRMSSEGSYINASNFEESIKISYIIAHKRFFWKIARLLFGRILLAELSKDIATINLKKLTGGDYYNRLHPKVDYFFENGNLRINKDLLNVGENHYIIEYTQYRTIEYKDFKTPDLGIKKLETETIKINSETREITKIRNDGEIDVINYPFSTAVRTYNVDIYIDHNKEDDSYIFLNLKSPLLLIKNPKFNRNKMLSQTKEIELVLNLPKGKESEIELRFND